MEPPPPARHRLGARESFVFWAIGALVVLFLLLLSTAIDVVLLTFAGLLFGITIRRTGAWIAPRVHASPMLGVLLVLGIFLGFVSICLLWIIPHLSQQAGLLWRDLMQSFEQLRGRLSGTTLGGRVFASASQIQTWLEKHVTLATGVVTAVIGGLGALLYVVFVAIYYAFSPWPYRRGVLALVPPRHRERANEILDVLGRTLSRWLLARAISMTVLGIASWIGLWLLGIPLALTLGLLAGILLFVPYLGSLAAATPPLLIAATISPWRLLYVAVLYVGIHLADGYLLDPAIQKRAIHLPPLLVLGSQLLAGALWGIIGFTIATPLVAALIVLVRMIYVEGILHAEPPPESPESADAEAIPA